MKCTGKHLTKDCKKPIDATQCGEPHSANYKGCMVAKELQKLRNKILKAKTFPSSQDPKAIVNKKAVTSNVTTKTHTFAQITKGAETITNANTFTSG